MHIVTLLFMTNIQRLRERVLDSILVLELFHKLHSVFRLNFFFHVHNGSYNSGLSFIKGSTFLIFKLPRYRLKLRQKCVYSLA